MLDEGLGLYVQSLYGYIVSCSFYLIQHELGRYVASYFGLSAMSGFCRCLFYKVRASGEY